jgi:hypothetical protein
MTKGITSPVPFRLSFIYHSQNMIHSYGPRLMVVILILCALSLGAQTRYTLVGEQTIQQRLDLYKGDDSAREAALLKLFTEAGCQTREPH